LDIFRLLVVGIASNNDIGTAVTIEKKLLVIISYYDENVSMLCLLVFS